MSYTKLFSSIVTSTIWTEDAETCKVWVTMLAIADKNGEVRASIPGLAQISGISLESTERAISKFLSPDRYSRTPDDEGRRIEVIDGGWALLNHAKYRAMASKDEQKASHAARQAKYRDRLARNQKVTPRDVLVTDSDALVTHDRDIAEAEADADPLNTNTVDFGLIFDSSTKPDKSQSTPEMLRIGRIINPNRRDTTKWSKDEAKAFKTIEFIEDEISLVEDFYRFTERDREPLYRRTSLLTLLRHWNDEVGKANKWAAKYGRTRTTTNNNRTGK